MTRSGAAQGAVDAALASASSTAPAGTDAQPKKWVSAVTSRVSTKWIGGTATVLILGATAAFGGLGAVPEPPLPEVAAGDTFTGAGWEMTPQRAVLIDELNETGVRPKEGERLLVVVMDVTNVDDAARQSSSSAEGSLSAIRVEDAPDIAPMIARYDDTTLYPWLQPGVPAQLVLTWAIPASGFAGGDDIRVALPTATEYTGEFFVYGEYWDDEQIGAHATLPLDDVGAGVEE
ncbi:hypothetical protein [Microbacterium sp. NPDC056234]|uniref:hypothetical protein n=1 Tax=Microbacterium sp. NPDC056234 TaxID=3345757 RepID=UPI0035E07A04